MARVARICLNMIVRDEAHVIEECLGSLSSYIDYWVICDTGSTDNTPALIENYFERNGIPGELHRHQWENFGVNRSKALDLARGKADYAWVIDADDYLVGEPDFSELTAASYDLYYRDGPSCTYWRPQLFRMDLGWQYHGVVHEYASSPERARSERLAGNFHIQSRRLGGARNLDRNKYSRDIELLLTELKKDPGDARSVFYLAQSYYDNGDLSNAEDWYRRRSVMGGWEEEIFFSKLRVGLALELQHREFDHIRAALLDAWESRAVRAEPLYHLARICRNNSLWNQAYAFAGLACAIPQPIEDRLFVDESVWRWKAKDELSIAAYWVGQFLESDRLCGELLDSNELPSDQLERVRANKRFAEEKLA